MNIIVVGCGRVGSHLATLLSEDGHNVSVIDRNADSFKNLGRDFNGRIVRGIGFDESALLDAGIDEADVIAAVTSNDNANLMIAEVARRIYEVPHVISRLYEARREKTYAQLGIDFACGSSPRRYSRRSSRAMVIISTPLAATSSCASPSTSKMT